MAASTALSVAVAALIPGGLRMRQLNLIPRSFEVDDRFELCVCPLRVNLYRNSVLAPIADFRPKGTSRDSEKGPAAHLHLPLTTNPNRNLAVRWHIPGGDMGRGHG